MNGATVVLVLFMMIMSLVAGWYFFLKVEEIAEVPCEDDPTQDGCQKNCEIEIDWGDCSSQCGGGTQTGIVTITSVAEYGGSCLYQTSGETTERNCNTQDCPGTTNGPGVGSGGPQEVQQVLPFYEDSRSEYRISPLEYDDHTLTSDFAYHENQLVVPNPAWTEDFPILIFSWTGSRWDSTWKTIENPVPSTGYPRSSFGTVVAIHSGTLITEFVDRSAGYQETHPGSGEYMLVIVYYLRVYTVGGDVSMTQQIEVGFSPSFIKFHTNGNKFVTGTGENGVILVYTLREDGTWEHESEITGTEGSQVSFHGDYLAIGNRSNSDNGYTSSGVVNIYRHNSSSGNWEPFQSVRPSDYGEYQRFGQSVALTDSALFVGSDIDEDTNGPSGAVYMFKLLRSGSSMHFTQVDKFTPSREREWHEGGFGVSIDVQDDILVIGSSSEGISGTGSTLIRAGVVYVLKWSDSDEEWSETRIISSDAQDLSGFGSKVILDGNMLCVGAPHFNSNGAIYTYTNLNTVTVTV